MLDEIRQSLGPAKNSRQGLWRHLVSQLFNLLYIRMTQKKKKKKSEKKSAFFLSHSLMSVAFAFLVLKEIGS